MKVILIHGKDTNPNEKWYPEFINQIESNGIECIAPVLPKANDPILDEWLEEIEECNPDEGTVLVGHSRGGVAILRFLERMTEGLKVRKVILVATNSGFTKDIYIKGESNFGFYTEQGYDFERIRSHCSSFVVFHSKDDQWVPFEAGEKNAKALKAKFIVFDDRGHFGKDHPEFPELVEEASKVE